MMRLRVWLVGQIQGAAQSVCPHPDTFEVELADGVWLQCMVCHAVLDPRTWTDIFAGR